MSTSTLADTATRVAALYKQAVALTRDKNRASVSFLQRELKIGYNLAASIMDQMVEDGVCSKPNHAGRREVLGSVTIEGPGMEKVTLSDKQLHRVAEQMEIAEPSSYGGLNPATKEKLRQTVAKIERLEEEKKEVAEQIKEVYGEAKAFGFNTKALREVVKIRKIDKADREEQEMMLELYLMATGDA